MQGVTDYAIYMLDPEGRVSNWNLGAQRIKGYAPEEIIGQHFSQFYTDEDRAAGEPQQALETATRGPVRKGRSGVSARTVPASGRTSSSTPSATTPGNLIGFAKITRDITERREARRNSRRRARLLFQSQKMEAIGQLTGGIAHDFNNLLMAVLGSLELLRKRLPDDPRQRALLENAVEGARRGAALTNRMLSFARRQELKLETVDVPELVRGMTESAATLAWTSCEHRDAIPAGCTVSARRRQSAGNGRAQFGGQCARCNARRGPDRHCGTRGKHLHASGSGLKPGRYIALTISDSGEGMDEATLQRAMEPFFTTKGIGKGTGLGLSMVHGFAEQSGGKFTLRSRKGEGTTAELWLPMAEAEPQRADQAQRKAVRCMAIAARWWWWRSMTTPSSCSTLLACSRTSDMRPSPRHQASRRSKF